MNDLSYSRALLAKARPYIDAQVKKPFLQGLINGDLPVEIFQYWLKVDYPYLFNFLKVLAVGMAKADDPQDTAVFLEHVKGIQNEMLDHQGHAQRTGMPVDELLKHRPGPLKYSYMLHQLASAYQGPIAHAQAAILACQWGYGECCRTLMKQKPVADDHPYAKWFAFHSADVHLAGLALSLDLLDRHAAKCTDEQRQRLEEIFIISVQHETMLWDEYFSMTRWETH